MKNIFLRLYLLILSTFSAVQVFIAWQHDDTIWATTSHLSSSLLFSPNNEAANKEERIMTIGRHHVAIRLNKSWKEQLHLPSQTVDGHAIPGEFFQSRLYLMGARLTTSYERDDSSVMITVFGIPGRSRLPRDGTFHCDSDLDRSLWTHGNVSRKLQLFLQLECQFGTSFQPCAKPILMTRIETMSWDINVDELTLIWQANITHLITREELNLSQEVMEDGATIRAHFWVVEKRKQVTEKKQTIPLQSLMNVDIPLSTGSVGNIGPHSYYHQGATSSHFDLPPVGAALCVATFGESIQPYIAEFVQHHKNVGFERIVLGVLDDDQSNFSNNSSLRSLLHPFILDGTVLLSRASAPGMQCDTELLKVVFYNACLYHSKGNVEYVGVWDLDEYWLPPTTLQDNGGVISTYTPPSLGSHQRERDPLWKESAYATSYSILDAMKALSSYQESHGCSDSDWCFHAFPSFTVHRRQKRNGKDTRPTGKIWKDFERRDSRSNTVWLKSIAKTKYTFSAGYHEFGSCQKIKSAATSDATMASSWHLHNPGLNQSLREVAYPNSRSNDAQILCRNFRMDGFGNMHHFKNLMKRRGPVPNLSNSSKWIEFPLDEYAKHYGETVGAQLSL